MVHNTKLQVTNISTDACLFLFLSNISSTNFTYKYLVTPGIRSPVSSPLKPYLDVDLPNTVFVKKIIYKIN